MTPKPAEEYVNLLILPSFFNLIWPSFYFSPRRVLHACHHNVMLHRGEFIVIDWVGKQGHFRHVPTKFNILTLVNLIVVN